MGSLGGSSSKSSSKPLTPTQVQGYYNTLNSNSGGRLADFAANGTAPTAYDGIGAAGKVTAPTATATPVNYQPADITSQLSAPTLGAAAQVNYNALTPEQVTAAGGLGALQEQVARRQNAQTLAQYAADPTLTTFQRLRANQLENQDFSGTLDALAKEREAAITGLLSDQSKQQLTADLANQAATNQFGLTGAQMGLDYQKLLAGVLGDQQGRDLQAALANAAAANSTSQFNAQQQAGADQFNVATALTEAQRKYQAAAANAGLTSADLQALASIYFGGTGSTSSSSQSTPMFGGGDLINAATLGGLATGLISI